MRVEQIWQLTNTAAQETLGESVVVAEDLSNVVDIGHQIMDTSDTENGPVWVDFLHHLADHIGKVVFWDRPYVSIAPSIYMEAWRFGSIKEKIRADLPEAVENPTWALQDGVEYSPYVFHKPTVRVKYFNGRTTSRVEQSITRSQMEEAFSDEYQLASFVAMLEGKRRMAHEIRTDTLVLRTLGAAAVYASTKPAQTVTLLTEYNNAFGTTLTAEQALRTEGFLRYSIYRMGQVMDLMRAPNNIYNSGGPVVYTPQDRMKVIMLSDFARSAGVYLHDAPNQFNTGSLGIPGGDIVGYWQGRGTDDSFAERSKLMLKTEQVTTTRTITGLLAMVFDEEALGVTNYRSSVKSVYNARGDFVNYFDDRFAGYFNDYDEQCVIFTAT